MTRPPAQSVPAPQHGAAPPYAGNRYRETEALQRWCERRSEAPFDAMMPIIDPHHHLWDDDRGRYLAADYRKDATSGHRIVATVCVEALSALPAGVEPLDWSLREARLVAREAGGDAAATSFRHMTENATGGPVRLAAGYVAGLDFTTTADPTAALAALREASAGRLRGIRQSFAADGRSLATRFMAHRPRPGLMADARVRAGIGRLAAEGLVFDAWLFHTQLAELIALADAVPATTIVLNHVGEPLGIAPYDTERDAVERQWRAGIVELARRPNVVVKLGGLGMLAVGGRFHLADRPPTSTELAAAWSDRIRVCIEAFGCARCMFESNFPVDKQSGGFGVLWNAFQRIAAGHADGERSDLFHGTARRVYRLELPGW